MTLVTRKIVHVDMDAFYASVEQRDNPELRGQPVIVAWRSKRSVVCAASYEARPFGVHSAMPAFQAHRLCPKAVFVPPDFNRYRTISAQVRQIFRRYTELIEPLSLDEAYLDVTENNLAIPTATAIARQIREEIRTEIGLTASAGVAPNKFLAKIASDWRKPDGLFVIQPHEVEGFLEVLPVNKLPGVGRATATSLEKLNITTVADVRTKPLEELTIRFGKFGRRLHELSHGIDNNPVRPHRPRKSLSVETTFDDDKLLADVESLLDPLIERLWHQIDITQRRPHTVVLKLKTGEFRLITRRNTLELPPRSATDLKSIAIDLMKKIDLPKDTRYRLVGVGLSNFRPIELDGLQKELF